MRWLVFLAVTLFATSVTADNLLINPDFDLDPTIPGNGWSSTGTGSFLWIQSGGDPAPPSARTSQVGDESMILFQCVAVTGGLTLDFSSRSYTHSSSVPAHNGVSLSVFPTADCSGAPIETVIADQNSVPGWYMRERIGYVTPANTLSARIELFSEANGANNDISWDHVILTSQVTAAEASTWGGVKTLFR